MRAYIRTTGVIFALLAIWHVYELIHHLQRPETDAGFIAGVSGIIIVTGGIAFWAFRALKNPAAR